MSDLVKVNYNVTTGEIIGFYPDAIDYSVVPTPYIEIDEASHIDCIGNPGLRIVDIVNKKIITVTTVYCYSNDGLSSKEVTNVYKVSTGEVLFDHVPTATELTSAFPNYSAIIKQQRITALNQETSAKITAKERYYAAVVTSSLYTDAEVTSIVTQIKADKLAIYNDLKAKQEAIMNG